MIINQITLVKKHPITFFIRLGIIALSKVNYISLTKLFHADANKPSNQK